MCLTSHGRHTYNYIRVSKMLLDCMQSADVVGEIPSYISLYSVEKGAVLMREHI